MPSETPKQAKVMSAIAHGWKPKGKAAGITVKVAKEFHAADAGKKWGKGHDKGSDTPHHSPRHSPGGPANNDGYIPKLENHLSGKGKLAGHKKQYQGHTMGYGGQEDAHRPNQSYQDELREHWGDKANYGGSMGKNTKEVANTGPKDRGGSRLQEKCGMGHFAKDGKHPIGIGPMSHTGVAEHHRGHTIKKNGDVMTAHVKQNPMGGEAHGYGHNSYERRGFHRLSGHSGAHMVGHRTKRANKNG